MAKREDGLELRKMLLGLWHERMGVGADATTRK